MRILIVGAGAIGAVTAAYLTLGGEDVTLVCRRQAVADELQSAGLLISGKRGERTVKLKATSGHDSLEGLFDCCLIATKAYDMEQAAAEALPHLTPGAPVLAMQNGIVREALMRAVGPERAAGAIVTWSCTMLSPTHMEITGEGGFVLGMMDGSANPRLEAVRAALEHMAPARVTRDYQGEMYSKLIINSGITCGGALSGRTLGRLLLTAKARRFFIEIAREDMAVAEALVIQVPAFGGRLDYYRFLRGCTLTDTLRRHMTLLAVGFQYWRLQSSSLTALRRGGRTEVDMLNGWIAAEARELGLSAPVNASIVRLIKEIEQGKRAISPNNIAEALKG